MFRVFSFSCTYRTNNARNRTEADMLDAIRTDNYESFMLLRCWGEFDTFLKAFQCIREDIPGSEYQVFWTGEIDDRKKLRYGHIFDGVVIYEDDRPFLVFGKGGEK